MTAPRRAPHCAARDLAVRWLVLVGCCCVLVTALVACGSSGGPSIPSFSAAPGRFRIVPQPTHGAPPPQTLAFQGHRVLASLGDVDGSGSRSRVNAVFQVTDEKALVPDRHYRVGDSVRVGSVTVRIDGIYGTGTKHIAVDVTLS